MVRARLQTARLQTARDQDGSAIEKSAPRPVIQRTSQENAPANIECWLLSAAKQRSRVVRRSIPADLTHQTVRCIFSSVGHISNRENSERFGPKAHLQIQLHCSCGVS